MMELEMVEQELVEELVEQELVKLVEELVEQGLELGHGRCRQRFGERRMKHRPRSSVRSWVLRVSISRVRHPSARFTCPARRE